MQGIHHPRTTTLVCAILAAALLGQVTIGYAVSTHRLARGHPILIDTAGHGFTSTRLFDVPIKHPWGIAWAYACARHAGEFDVVVWDEDVSAELAYTTIFSHGPRAHGVRMETGATDNITTPNGKQGGYLVGLHVKTGCAWHVRVIAGPRPVVQRYALTRA